MITLRGHYYDGNTSAQVRAECRIYDNGAVHVRRAEDGALLLTLPRFEVNASPRLANTIRHLYFPQGQKFETRDNRAVDDILNRFRKRSWLHAVHLLESRKRYILACVAVLIAIMWGVGRYGVPAAAWAIARNLPQSVAQKAGSHTLDVLDRSVFKPSRIDDAVQQRLQSRFQPLIQDHRSLHLQILFRDGGRLGANAFALPSGAIVFTDQMVQLARNDDELLAVLAHEAGHVTHRHGIRRIIQDSLLAFAIMAITGDASGTSQLFLGLPVALTELAYSREFEREADQYALDYLRSHGISPRHFSDLMRRLQQEKHPDGPGGESHWSNYLSTHPDMEERLRRFEESGG
jgi:Zn-dependent protease with chaperone function